jgi:hypothetical protein
VTSEPSTSPKQEIAENLVRISGEVREAIVFVEEPATAAPGSPTDDAKDLFADATVHG